jgi:hypothetical protein
MRGQILIQSWPTIRQGRRVVEGTGNHWTDSGVRDIMYLLFSNYKDTTGRDYECPFGTSWVVIGIGTDQTTPTNPTMTGLVNVKSYKADGGGFVEFVKEADGQYRAKYQRIWNANHFPSSFTIGEVGLFIDASTPATDTGTPGDSGTNHYPNVAIDGSKMKARASVADGTLQAFTVDPTLALIVEWTIRMAWK